MQKRSGELGMETRSEEEAAALAGTEEEGGLRRKRQKGNMQDTHEAWILRREDVSVRIRCKNGENDSVRVPMQWLPDCRERKGCLLLSTYRAIIQWDTSHMSSEQLQNLPLSFNNNPGSSTECFFEIPLHLVNREKYNQPFFGRNYLSGSFTINLSNGPETNDSSSSSIETVDWELYFNNGSAGTLLSHFFLELSRARTREGNISQSSPNDCINREKTEREINCQHVAYFDPNDPTIVLIPVSKEN